MSEEAQGDTRRVRPWIAALLTFLGLGVGLFYARRTHAAIWMAVFSVASGVASGLGFAAYVLMTHTFPLAFFNPNGFSFVDLVGVVISVVAAIWVWVFVAKRQQVEKAGPVRLLGYLAIWLVPLLVTAALAMALRFTTIHPFRIPSGAMQPTLNVGDYVLVAKWSYGYSRFSIAPFESLAPSGRWRAHVPERGDIAVFRPTPEPDRDFVKRIVGLPGDRIQMIGGVLNINGSPVARQSLGEQTFGADGSEFQAQVIRETLPNGVSYLTLDRGVSELDDTQVFVVPAGHYFAMGDDRDNSADSRVPSVIGYIPFDNLIGRVDEIFTPR